MSQETHPAETYGVSSRLKIHTSISSMFLMSCAPCSLLQLLLNFCSCLSSKKLSPQAAARQNQFEQTAVGRAATRAVREAKKPAPARTERQQESNARDWLN